MHDIGTRSSMHVHAMDMQYAVCQIEPNSFTCVTIQVLVGALVPPCLLMRAIIRRLGLTRTVIFSKH